MKLISFILLAYISYKANCSNPCGDNTWIQSKDEKCYKIVSTNFVTRDEAETICNNARSDLDDVNETYYPALAEIHTPEEQSLIERYVFGQMDVYDNVWIRAKRGSDGKFYWKPDSEVIYTNWASENPSADTEKDCVAMMSGWSSKRKFTRKSKNIRDQNDVNLEDEEVILDNNENDLVELQTSSNIKPDAGRWKNVACQSRGLAVCQKSQTWTFPKIQTTLMQIRTNLKLEVSRLTNEISNMIPIGFIYVQIPGQKSPQELWPTFTFTDVSAIYAGQFFRVSGGNSGAFGVPQAENSPRLVSVHSHHRDFAHDVGLPAEGESYPVYGGSSDGTTYSISFGVHGGEVRPYNTATLIWQRTA